MIIRIATRQSPLALWQAHHVSALLRGANPGVEITIVSTETFADRDLSLPIAELGGKGAFSKEIQQLVLAGEADIAVHSAKDLQAVTPDGLVIGAFPERGDDRDALIGCALDRLPAGATVATGSNRRRVQLQHLRPDLRFEGLRGNIQTRLAALDDTSASGTTLSAIVMANAALGRLGLAPGIVNVLDPSVMVPQVGQGALAVECRADDDQLQGVLRAIDHAPSRCRVEAERGFLVELGGNCDLPAGAHAEFIEGGKTLRLRAVLASEDERRLERTTVVTDQPFEGPIGHIGAAAARTLRDHLDQA